MERQERSGFAPGAGELRDIFRQEVAAAGGTIVQEYNDGERLFARATLSRLKEAVRPGDGIKGGVALRTNGPQVRIHPYTFRVVCSNGAIGVRAADSRQVERAADGVDLYRTESVVEEVRAAIRAACSPEAFGRTLEEMRSALDMDGEIVLGMANLLLRSEARLSSQLAAIIFRDNQALHSRLQPGRGRELTPLLGAIETRFRSEGDPSLFGLMNAITAEARQVEDPEVRWSLEELGAAVGAFRLPVRAAGLVRMFRRSPLFGSDGLPVEAWAPGVRVNFSTRATVEPAGRPAR